MGPSLGDVDLAAIALQLATGVVPEGDDLTERCMLVCPYAN